MEVLSGKLGSVGLAAPEQAAPKTPRTTMLAIATPVRTLIAGAVCRKHPAIRRASPQFGGKKGQRSMPATGLRLGEPSSWR